NMEVCLWIIFFMLFPDLNMGLLSDYKICGDPECESPMSRVQAVKSHEGKDCRFLNFRRGDTIFVYHKLTGKREDLWAGSIDKQFGYFPKDAVREEEVFATMRKVLETQESDFFCMDESGYPLDTSHLDTDEDDDLNFQDHEPKSSQISPHSHDTNAQDELKTSTIPEQQGGSPSSSWLRSSVTGWLGFAKEEQSEIKENEETGDEKEPTETFRSRRMSLDLEGSKLQEEEKEDMGTIGWLGSGLASRLGFGSSGQDSEGEGVEVQEEKPSSSWMEMGIGSIWGFGGSNTGADGSKESGIRETERDQMLEQPSGFENVDISQSEASFTEEIKDIDAGIFNKDDSIHNSSQVDDENIGEHKRRDEQISQN
uniref:CTAGE family member 5, ER export factor n=1 Tax=Poecilia formosa TaxID=48698 RepID=A0A096MGY5_POEFO